MTAKRKIVIVGSAYPLRGGGISTYEWQEGTLILDIVKAADNELIWRGGASRALPSSTTPEKTDKIIKEAVSKILKKYPPKK